MAKRNIQIDTIYNGQSPSYLIGGDYLSALAIDPDANVSPIINKISGAISPTSHESFLELDGNPLWIKPNPKNDNTFVYTDTGKLYKYDKDFNTVGSTGTLTNSKGNGLTYYNGFYYAFKDTDLDRITVDGDITENYLSTIKSNIDIYNPRSTSQDETSIGGSNNTTKTAIAFKMFNTPTSSINNISFVSKRNSNTSATQIKISVVRDDTGNPTGAEQGSVTMNYSDLPENYDLVNLTGNISLTSAFGPFWVKIEAVSGFNVDDKVFFKIVTSSEYPNGALKNYEGSWSDVSIYKGLQFILSYKTKLLPNMGNSTYPFNGVTRLPNHTAHVHNDTLYYCDFIDNRGIVESIKTITQVEVEFVENFFTVNKFVTGITSKATATVVLIQDNFYSSPFDTPTGTKLTTKLGLINITGEFIVGETIGTPDAFGRLTIGSGQAGNGVIQSITQGGMYDLRATGTLELPYGMHPVSLESFGSDIAVLAIQTTDDTVFQGEARLYLWDRYDVSYYREIKLPYATATALLSHNGIPYLWGGDDKGYSFAYYAGGDQVTEIFYIDDGKPPLSGAVAGENNRILWGSNATYPETAGTVLAWGSRNASLPRGLHTVARDPNNNQITSLAIGTISEQNIIIGSEGIIAKDGGELNSMFRSKVINVGQNFTVNQITLPLSDIVDEDTEITLSVFVDNETRSKEVITIDSSTYKENKVVIYPEFSGQNNFFIELKWSKTKRVSVLLPITIKISVDEE